MEAHRYRAANPDTDTVYGEPNWLVELPPDLLGYFRDRDQAGYPRWMNESTMGICMLCLCRLLKAVEDKAAEDKS